MIEFATLEPQDVRAYWSHEEREFTPWVADEIEADGPSGLENILGLDLEVIEMEKRIGKYRVDIFGRVVEDGRTFIVENQLGPSDHDHLGKAIAYAAGVDADIIIWIAPEFNDEHIDALQWMNENSREGIDLFAIRLEVWTIEDSPPAVRLNPIEKPSEWKEKARRSGGQVSERDARREQFWTAFRDRIVEADTPLRPRKPQPRHYYSNPIGASGTHISYTINEDEGVLRLDLIITDGADAYRELSDQSAELEAALGQELHWGELRETPAGRMRSNVGVMREIDIEDADRWEEYFDWMLEQGTRFHEVFPDRFRRLV